MARARAFLRRSSCRRASAVGGAVRRAWAIPSDALLRRIGSTLPTFADWREIELRSVRPSAQRGVADALEFRGGAPLRRRDVVEDVARDDVKRGEVVDRAVVIPIGIEFVGRLVITIGDVVLALRDAPAFGPAD